MNDLRNPGRRELLRRAALGLSLAPLALAAAPAALAAAAGSLPLISEQDPAAKAVHYVEDASRAEAAASGAHSSTCPIYSAPAGATQGPCTLSRGRLAKAAAWCTSWSGL